MWSIDYVDISTWKVSNSIKIFYCCSIKDAQWLCEMLNSTVYGQ